ncbi:lysine--tRNA ligase [Alkalimarinus sediminis]
MSKDTMNEENQIQQDENKLVAERRGKLSKLRENCKSNGHPNDFRRADMAGELQAEFGHLDKEALAELGKPVSVAGRVMRRGGPFVGVQDMSGSIQCYLGKKLQKDSEAWVNLDIGDIVGASGILQKSGKGDLYVEVVDVNNLRILTKALRPLPEKFHGLADQEAKYRQRYVDLIISEETRKTFQIRSKIINAMRRYLEEKGFMEAETPMLQVIPGGATAKPFITKHNAMDMDMYLRIAPELYLKRLVVGGFEKVFEINRNFRNEGLSTRHNPEFTMIEFYQAYADYNDLMDLTEDMLRTIATEVLGTTTLPYGDAEYDLGKPFWRISVFDSILHFNPDLSAADIDNLESATKVAENLGIDVKPGWGLGKVQIEIFEKTVEHRLDQPTFITRYPTEVSPLARRNDDDAFVTDRFEFFVGGREIANGFSELNDAEDQAGRFRQQVEEKDAGDDEAMHFDDDYIRALEHGLPPTAGEGIGIDRLVMLFTNTHTIKDVILFPHMKPRG